MKRKYKIITIILLSILLVLYELTVMHAFGPIFSRAKLTIKDDKLYFNLRYATTRGAEIIVFDAESGCLIWKISRSDEQPSSFKYGAKAANNYYRGYFPEIGVPAELVEGKVYQIEISWVHDVFFAPGGAQGGPIYHIKIENGKLCFLDNLPVVNNYRPSGDFIISAETDYLNASIEPDIVWITIDKPEFTGQISKYEITNIQFAQFLNDSMRAGKLDEPTGNLSFGDYITYYEASTIVYFERGWNTDGAISGGRPRIRYINDKFVVESGFENHPVTCVMWDGAKAFADFYNWKLPSEEQWQAVADFDGSYNYGCGIDIDNSKANYRGSIHPHGITPVGSFGEYGYGVADMAGNVWEWTSSVDDEGNYIIRGGCWYNGKEDCLNSARYSFSSYHALGCIGFRVCR